MMNYWLWCGINIGYVMGFVLTCCGGMCVMSGLLLCGGGVCGYDSMTHVWLCGHGGGIGEL